MTAPGIKLLNDLQEEVLVINQKKKSLDRLNKELRDISNNVLIEVKEVNTEEIRVKLTSGWDEVITREKFEKISKVMGIDYAEMCWRINGTLELIFKTGLHLGDFDVKNE